ncbi:MAG TPA: DinB family protein [Vicinamibacterales bacterium]|nr:DinB family protein [Vicinamibacterales bacterium]
MRLISLLCLAVLAVAPAAPPATLTAQERDAAVKYLEETSRTFVDSIENVSEAQWTFKAGPDRWSIAETAEHIAVSEGTLFQLITEKIVKGPAIPADTPKLEDKRIIEGVVDRTSKFQAPEMLRPTNRWATRDALLKDFLAERQKTIEYVKTTTEDLRSHGGPHPVMKMLDGYQWILFLGGHCARHTAQIEEVKTSPGYPAEP